MDPITINAGVQAISGIAGMFSSRRKRKQARRKQTRFKSLLGQQYGALQRAVGAERAEFATRAGFLRESQQIQQQQAVQQYGSAIETMQSNIGRTGLAGVGSGLQSMEQAQTAFGTGQEQFALQNQQNAFQLQQQEASRIRDIQATGFQMDTMAAEQGIKSSYGQSLLDMYGGI
tara:strand:- start:109 stop:630 length:522 start_codon:yes stop_codon:yes gene_type:complete